MADNEDYLDGLLSSVNGSSGKDRRKKDSGEASERNSDDSFLAEYDALLADEDEDFLEEYEKSLGITEEDLPSLRTRKEERAAKKESRREKKAQEKAAKKEAAKEKAAKEKATKEKATKDKSQPKAKAKTAAKPKKPFYRKKKFDSPADAAATGAVFDDEELIDEPLQTQETATVEEARPVEETPAADETLAVEAVSSEENTGLLQEEEPEVAPEMKAALDDVLSDDEDQQEAEESPQEAEESSQETAEEEIDDILDQVGAHQDQDVADQEAAAEEEEALRAAMAAAEEAAKDPNQELLDILNEMDVGDDLGGINDILAVDEEGKPLPEDISVDDIEFSEYTPSNRAIGTGMFKSGEDKEEFEIKQGPIGRFLSKLFFGEKAVEEQLEADAREAAISPEDQRIIDELENKKKAEAQDAKKAEKEAKKAEKKAAAEAKAAEKKAAAEAKAAEKAAKKAEKPKKEKKEKPPKDPNAKPINKRPIIVTLLFTVSVVVLVNLLSKTILYISSIDKSEEDFNCGDYITAYNDLQGLSIRAGDQDFFYQTRLMAGLESCIEKYETFSAYGDDAMAVDALIRGIGKYETNKEEAGSLGISTIYQEAEQEIEGYLATYGITYDQAVELYDMMHRDDYTVAILELLE